MRVTYDDREPEEPAPTWQGMMFGLQPESVAQQGTLFELGEPEAKPKRPEDDPGQPSLFER
jgi:hypothetical protein